MGVGIWILSGITLNNIKDGNDRKNFVFSYWKNGILTSKFGFGDEFPFYSSTALDVIWGLLSQSYAGE